MGGADSSDQGSPRGGAFLRAAGRAMVRTSEVLADATAAVADGTSSVLAQALAPEERSLLSIELYDSHYRPSLEETDLYPWEERWFSEDLPPSPGRLLVGAAGGCREVGALLDLGYEVDAFEPASRPRRHGEALYGGRAEIRSGDYADLCAAAAGDHSSPLFAFARRPYDAVLLGWGSFTHLPDAAARGAVLGACDTLTPGPILASFYFAGPGEKAASEGAAAHWGTKLGRRIGRLRGTRGIDDKFVFRPWGGFAHHLSLIDVETAARSVCRRVTWYLDDTFPHVTITRP